MRMGRVKLPAAVPDRQKAFARDLRLSKYRAVRTMPRTKVNLVLWVIFYFCVNNKYVHGSRQKGLLRAICRNIEKLL